MTDRREFIIGGLCVAGAGLAVALKPRSKVSLMPKGRKLAAILPRSFKGWVSQDVSDLYAPETKDSLLARLYGETVGRIYSHPDTSSAIMMLMAHGESESNELQLHRPEVCYPAFGYSIIQTRPALLQVTPRVSLPGREMVVKSAEQTQAVTYWTRLGEFFPTGVTEQRIDRLNTAMHRYIPDGLLARFSVVDQDVERSFLLMSAFIRALIQQVPAADRVALVGTERAQIF